MIYVYAGLSVLILLGMIVSAGYKKDLIKSLDKKEHPFRIFYPLAARLTDLRKKTGNKSRRSEALLKSICVKENVDKESYALMLKKTALAITLVAGAALLGTFMCVSDRKASNVKSIERNAAGGQSRNVELEVAYQGREELVNIEVEAEKLTEEEILKKLDNSIDGIFKKALGENKDAQKVNKPLELIYEYNGIKIRWEIEDTELVGYDGQIKIPDDEKNTFAVTLFATLSLDGVSKTYNFPIAVSAREMSEKEKLVSDILKEIEEGNSGYEKKVDLPESLNGQGISFSRKRPENEAVILVIALLAAAIIFIGYDRILEEKVKKRNDQLLMDFAEITSRLSLLYGAGCGLRQAWERIVKESEKRKEKRFAYSEMKLALEKMKNGMSENEAYKQFGKRCGLHQYIKLGNLLDQNLSKGSRGLKEILKAESEEAFEERKRLARKKGEEAGTKMLVPMVLMMLVVVVIVAVPALMSINL